jgi:acetyltransferase-like isoleucine patch superfamily enzyme
LTDVTGLTEAFAHGTEPRWSRVRRRLLGRLVHRGRVTIQRYGAIAPGTDQADRFGSFGEGAIIAFPPAAIYGEANIHVGPHTLINSQVTLSAGYDPDQPDVPPRALVIGARCLIGLRSSIVAHESIEIGDDVWFGQGVFVTDSNHGFDDPDVPIGQQLGTHQPVTIGAGSWIGHGAVVLPGAQIGRNVVVAAGSVVRGEVADHSVVGGVPAKVLRPTAPGERLPRPNAATG